MFSFEAIEDDIMLQDEVKNKCYLFELNYGK